MNRHVLVALSLLTSVVVAILYFYIGHSNHVRSIQQNKELMTTQRSRSLSGVVNLLRNQILQGDVRGTRNVFERMISDELISGYAILPSSGGRFQSMSFSEVKNQQSQFLIEIPVLFGRNGKAWGSIEFLIPLIKIQSIAKRAEGSLIKQSVYLVLLLFLAIQTVFFLFWKTGSRLGLSLNHFLEGRLTYHSDKLTESLWRPLLARFKVISQEILQYQSELIEVEKKLALTKLAKQVAHDIRSPLTGLEVVSSRLTGLGSDEKSMVESSIQRIRSIADDLLNLDRSLSLGKKNVVKISDGSRKEGTGPSKMIKSNLSKQDLGRIIEECFQEKKLELLNKDNIKFRLYHEERIEHLSVNIDVSSFKRVLSNLLNNAIESIDSDKKGFISLSVSTEGRNKLIEIRDNGCGIGEKSKNNIFEHGVSIGKVKGNGLGLSYARDTIDGFGGNLTLSSQVGLGTTVSLYLPIAD